ncbi:unnamed protein product [Tuber aestivum]|uniref:Uncharacterized protein n=1 Tax=Tuber aestivum TaxID=59557 RepID=A0A292PJ48_9PEZI|nr:unnamed protein product [Tuber aestivum]
MIRILCDSARGGGRGEKKWGGIDTRKGPGAIGMRRTCMSLLAAAEEEQVDAHDPHHVQRMEMIVSPITSTPETQRVVRTILRREYESIVKEAEEGNKQVQKYLVATDLSGEAQHAPEWKIGTVLGDGDTLMAI